MSDYRKQHIEKKNAVIECLNQAESFFSEKGYEKESRAAAAQRSNVESGEFSIAVVGEFSAGKSTFLNALMGEKILPSFTKETTATVNFLRHKEKSVGGEGGRVYFADGREEVIPVVDEQNIKKFVSTESEIEVAKNISHLDLYLDSQFLEDNVILVDTPGLNGIAEGHRELTEEQIERSSAGIFLFDANQPGKQTDFDFIRALRTRLKNIIFVLNKIDNIKQSEGETVESVTEKLKESYRKVYGEGTKIPEIWPVSAYNALCARDPKGTHMDCGEEEQKQFEEISRMKAFEERLWRFLTRGEKTRAMLMTPLEIMESCLKEVKAGLEIEKDAISGAVDALDIEQEKLNIQKSMEELEEQKKAKTAGIRSALTTAADEFTNAVKSGAEGYKNRLTRQIDNFMDIEEIEPQAIKNRIDKELTRIAENAYEEYCYSVRQIQAQYAVEITDHLNDELSDGLNVKIDCELEIPEFNVGLERMEKEENELKEEIARLADDAEKSELSMVDAITNSEKRRQLEKQIEKKRQERDLYERSSMEWIPEARIYTKNVERRRQGFHPFRPNEWIPDQVVDKSERENYMEQRQGILERYNSDIDKLEEKLQSMPGDNSKLAQKMMKQKQQLLAGRREELTQLRERNNAEIIKKNETRLKRLKTSLKDHIDDVVRTFTEENKKGFRSNRDSRVRIILDIIGGSIQEKLSRKQQELELLERKQSQAVEEKNTRLAEIQEQIDKIRELSKQIFEIKDMIDADEIDSIQEITV